MRLNDLMRVSIRQVIRHRRRYMGVVLAIALGVAGFLNIVTMTREVKRNFNEDLDLIGGVTVIRLSFDNQRASRPQTARAYPRGDLCRGAPDCHGQTGLLGLCHAPGTGGPGQG